MRKGDNYKKVFGVILILAIIVSVFGGVVLAEDVSGGLKQNGDAAEIQTAVGNLSSGELTEALDAVTDDTVNIEFADQSAELGVVSSRSYYDRQAAYNYAYEYWDEVCSDGYFWNTPTGWISLSLGTNIVGWTGYDCAHFVSCCIGSEPNDQGGGLPVPEEYPSGPYGIPSSTRLCNWLIDGGTAVEVYSLAQLEKGDVIFYDLNENGLPDHSVLHLGNGKIAAHTACYWNVNWDIYNPRAGYYKFVHIKSATAQPDLLVEDIWVDPDPPNAGASNRIRFRIKN